MLRILLTISNRPSPQSSPEGREKYIFFSSEGEDRDEDNSSPELTD